MAKKTEKKIMKQRRKAKARAKHQREIKVARSPQSVIRRAKEYPLVNCWITSGWEEDGSSGLVTVLVARRQPDELIAWGSYLIDVYCLGLKDTMANANFTLTGIREEVLPRLYPMGTPEECSPELAHQMIYQAIDYAAQYDFKPQRDFKTSRNLLAPRGTYEEPYNLTFGKDGKPFFVAGPYDNVRAIIASLERNPGPGHYDYFVPMDLPGARFLPQRPDDDPDKE